MGLGYEIIEEPFAQALPFHELPWVPQVRVARFPNTYTSRFCNRVSVFASLSSEPRSNVDETNAFAIEDKL